MRRLLAVLAPWMAMTAALAQAPDRVDVQYSHRSLAKGAGVRVDQSVYVGQKFVESIGWYIDFQRTGALVSGEGRTMRLTVREFSGTPMVDLSEALRVLGGVTAWSADQRTLLVTGAIRSLERTPTGIRVDSTIGVSAKAFRLETPDRLVVDIQGASIEPERLPDLPAGWRIAQYAGTTVRLVIEDASMRTVSIPNIASGRTLAIGLSQSVAAPTKQTAPGTAPIVVHGGTVRDNSSATARIALDFSGTPSQRPSARYLDPQTIVVLLPAATLGDSSVALEGSSRLVRSARLEAVGSSTVSLTLSMTRPMAFQLGVRGQSAVVELSSPGSGGLAGKVVIVDAGHGGHDSGAHSGGAMEKVYALDLAKRLADELAKAGASVIMTRDDDTFVPLGERSAIANRSAADVFISCHFNSNTVSNSRSGTIVFFHMQSSMGRLLAECARSEIAKVSGLPDLGCWSDTRIYNSGFAVLRNSDMPGVLLEMGFVNHAGDRARIKDASFRQSIAGAVARGLREYFTDGR